MSALKKVVDLSLDGITYKLAFDFEAIAEAEEITGKSLLLGLSSSDATSPKINLVRAMFYACAKSEQSYLTYEQAKALVKRDNIIPVWTKVIEAWVGSHPDVKEVAADPEADQK